MQMLIEVFSHYWLGLCMQSKCDFSLSAASTVDSESYLQLDATLYIRDTRTSVYFSTSKKKATSGFALNRGLTVPIDIATVLQTFLYTNLLRGALAAILLVESLHGYSRTNIKLCYTPTCKNGHLYAVLLACPIIYRIAGIFRGYKCSWFSRIRQNREH